MGQAFRVVIIGAGKIGAFFDTPGHGAVLTHAHAFCKNSGFSLAGFVDADGDQAAKAAGIWGCQAFASLEDAFDRGGPVDVAVVAVPDHAHAAVVRDLCRYPIRLIFLEKPVAGSMGDAREIVAMCGQKGCDVLVNYSRRFVPEFQRLHAQIRAGDFGRFMTGSACYGKGVVHNGSHAVDLVRYLLGEIRDVHVIGVMDDFVPEDPSVSAALVLEEGQTFLLHAVDSRKVSIFELDLLFEKARVRIVDSGMRIEGASVEESAVFPGYRIFGVARGCRTALDHALEAAVQNIADHLNGRADLVCGLDDAFQTAGVCFRLADEAGGL